MRNGAKALFLNCVVVAVVWEFVSCQTMEAGKNLCISSYKAFLGTLSKESPDSIGAAVREYQTTFHRSSRSERDAGFLVFRDFYYETLKSVDQTDWNQIGEDPPFTYDAICNKLMSGAYDTILGANGIAVYTAEGCLYLGEPDTFLLSTFGPYVSKPIRAYLQIRQAELRERYQHDACLTISFTQVAQRCIAWEQYLDRYPQSNLQRCSIASILHA